MSTSTCSFFHALMPKKTNPKVLNCELSRLLRHLATDEINHKMFCPESSLSLLQVDVGGGEGEI